MGGKKAGMSNHQKSAGSDDNLLEREGNSRIVTGRVVGYLGRKSFQ